MAHPDKAIEWLSALEPRVAAIERARQWEPPVIMSNRLAALEGRQQAHEAKSAGRLKQECEAILKAVVAFTREEVLPRIERLEASRVAERTWLDAIEAANARIAR
jgi:hypothetical protein